MRAKWDEEGTRLYETGTKKGIVFPMKDDGTYDKGVAWSGLTAVTKSPGGAEPNDVYADDIKYLTLLSAETLSYTIECLYYPDEFAECNGTKEEVPGVIVGQQPRRAFGFSYRTILGNDVKGNDYGYKLHLLYNSKCSPSEESYQTVNESPETKTMSFECNTTAVKIDEDHSTCSITIDSTKVDAEKLTAFENILYGSDGTDSYVETTDVTMQAGKTYYEKNASDEYVVTTDTAFDSGKTYYEKVTTGASDPRLMSPADVIAFFRAG